MTIGVHQDNRIKEKTEFTGSMDKDSVINIVGLQGPKVRPGLSIL